MMIALHKNMRTTPSISVEIASSTDRAASLAQRFGITEATVYKWKKRTSFKATMLVKGAVPKAEDAVTPDDAIKNPYVLEFLDFKNQYSEPDLEQALFRRLEDFLLERRDGLAFVGRQRRLSIEQTWY